jgi:hypothetical protein
VVAAAICIAAAEEGRVGLGKGAREGWRAEKRGSSCVG